MHSIRTRFTLLTVCAVVISVGIAAAIGAVSIKNLGDSDARQMLLLLCTVGEKNLDSYFDSVEQSVRTVSKLVQEGLDSADEGQLARQVDQTRLLFARAAAETHGVLTYYYRVDPEATDAVQGFWYTDVDGEGFVEHEVTDIARYDAADPGMVWFTVPKTTGEAIWLPPYVTENLDARVLSYNVPVYWQGRFFGVIGIELDYRTLAEEVDHIRLYNNGYAFVTDAAGKLICHPRIDAAALAEADRPAPPDGLLSEETNLRYRFEGVEKMGAWLPLNSGMRLTVCVPVSEVNGQWQHLVRLIVAASLLVLIAASLIVMRFTGHLTKPLRDLTAAAEHVDQGNYEFDLDYSRNDEVGILTRTFKHLVEHMQAHISDLNKRVFIDALTSVRNKGAFNNYMQQLQEQTDEGALAPFAVAIFDCDNLKRINDGYGHDKGDAYLKEASALICRIFQHSPVFRIGGDEFAAVLQNGDFEKREELLESFRRTREEICRDAQEEWRKISITVGMAVYDPAFDRTVFDTVKRADMRMYEIKRARKEEP